MQRLIHDCGGAPLWRSAHISFDFLAVQKTALVTPEGRRYEISEVGREKNDLHWAAALRAKRAEFIQYEITAIDGAFHIVAPRQIEQVTRSRSIRSMGEGRWPNGTEGIDASLDIGMNID